MTDTNHLKMDLLLTGVPASEGVAEGIVKVVGGVDDIENFNEGDVLVTRLTDPTMVIMMAKAAAIVCDIGGVTSHPAIVSRELGIPCVVNTGQATEKLEDGMKVKVDGTEGKVYEFT